MTSPLLNMVMTGYINRMQIIFEELSCKTACNSIHVSHFLFCKIMIRLDFIICWFSLYFIAEKSIKIFFHEIKLGEKVEPHYHIDQIFTLYTTYLNEEHVVWTEAVLSSSFIHCNTTPVNNTHLKLTYPLLTIVRGASGELVTLCLIYLLPTRCRPLKKGGWQPISKYAASGCGS